MTGPAFHPGAEALEDYLKTLDFDQGVLITQAHHHQGEVRLFAPNRASLPEKLIIKRPKGQGLRYRLARKTLQREYRAYRRLNGLDGFAQCFGLFLNQYLVLAFVDGVPLAQAPTPPPAFYHALRLTIEKMHAHGVAHGDLKKKDNVLVMASGEPVILDLGTAVIKQSGWHPIEHWLFDLIARTDLNAWIKHKYGGYDAVAPADRPYLNRSWPERVLSDWRSRKRSKP